GTLPPWAKRVATPTTNRVAAATADFTGRKCVIRPPEKYARHSRSETARETTKARSALQLTRRCEHLAERVGKHDGHQETPDTDGQHRHQALRVEAAGTAQDDANDEIEAAP